MWSPRGAGIDIGNDGEQQRVGFQTYVPQRMSGFGGEFKRRRGREFEEFPELAQYLAHRFPSGSRQQNAPQAQGELHYHDTSAIGREIARFQRIAGEDQAFAEAFMTAPSPGIIASTMLNAHYATHEAYLAGHRPRDEERVPGDPSGRPHPADRRARSRHGPHHVLPRQVGRRLHQGGRAARRHDQQRDRRHPARARAAPCLLRQLGRPAHPRHRARKNPPRPLSGRGRRAVDRVRQSAPRPRIRGAQARAAADGHDPHSRRHREHQQLRRHPEVVARRIEEAVAAVGDRERVIASADCGFGTFTRREWVVEPVVWLKLGSIRAGADIASARLWGRKVA